MPYSRFSVTLSKEQIKTKFWLLLYLIVFANIPKEFFQYYANF